MMECDQEMILWLTAWLEDPVKTARHPEFRIFLQQGTNRADFARLLRTYRRARKITLSHRIQQASAWEKTKAKAERIRRRRTLLRISRISVAASVVLLFACWWWWPEKQPETDLLAMESGTSSAIIRLADGKEYKLSDTTGKIATDLTAVDICLDANRNVRYVVKDSATQERQMNTLIVPRGGFYSIVLADGSSVKLNAESQLTYPVLFSAEERVVYLKGEAYFEVSANPEKPFRVICDRREVTVTGTKFNVSAYPEECMYTTLAEGVVAVSNGTEQQVLKPGEQAIVSDGKIQVRPVDVVLYMAWIDGKFMFDNARLEDIVKTLSRWYNVEFEFADSSLKELTFTLSAPCDENLLFVVKLLEGVSPARFKDMGERIEISAVPKR